MAVIFAFSAQPKEESSRVSEEVSESLLNVTGWLFRLNIDEERVYEIAQALERFVRKGGTYDRIRNSGSPAILVDRQMADVPAASICHSSYVGVVICRQR